MILRVFTFTFRVHLDVNGEVVKESVICPFGSVNVLLSLMNMLFVANLYDNYFYIIL